MNCQWATWLGCLSVILIGPDAVGQVHQETVHYRHGDTPLVGYLTFDRALVGKRPGILVVHEWWGLDEYARGRARQLAQLGYVAFALDMYGSGRTTSDAQQAKKWSGGLYANPDLLRQRAIAGLNVLAGHERVDSDRLAAIGYCFGGTTVLELAYSGAPVKAVASFHGGVALPRPGDQTPMKASVLICHGASDPLVPDEKVQELQRALDQVGADWQWVSYGGAVHSFTNPDADRAKIEGVAYQPMADRRSWQHLCLFLEQMLGRLRQP